MIIETNTQPPSYKLPLVLGIIITLSAVALPVIFVITPNSQPTGNILSPLPQGELANQPSIPLSFEQSLNLAQNYLNKAYELARDPDQSEADKNIILASLNQGLKQASNSIALSPRNPQGYLIRAQILTAASKINADTLKLAKEDLDIASKLSQNQNVVLPSPVNPINLLPDQQANLASNVTIASGATTSASPSASSASGGNASQGQVILPANQTELKVTNPKIKDSTYIYLVPTTNSTSILFVKSKDTGSFILSTTAAQSTDRTIDYYLINQ